MIVEAVMSLVWIDQALLSSLYQVHRLYKNHASLAPLMKPFWGFFLTSRESINGKNFENRFLSLDDRKSNRHV